MYRFFITLALIAGLVGCASTPEESLSLIQVGMDKDDVLKKSGSPWITRRINSEDLWVYRFYKQNQEYRKELRFKDGRVVAVEPHLPYPNPNVELENAEDLESFKKAAEKKNNQYNKGFKELTPSDDD